MTKVFIFGMGGLITIGLVVFAIVSIRAALWSPKPKEKDRHEEV